MQLASMLAELRAERTAINLLIECCEFYEKYMEYIAEHNRKYLDVFFQKVHQDLQDSPLHPLPHTYFVTMSDELARCLVWLYATTTTIKHPKILPSSEFAAMRTDPELPTMILTTQKGHMYGT